MNLWWVTGYDFGAGSAWAVAIMSDSEDAAITEACRLAGIQRGTLGGLAWELEAGSVGPEMMGRKLSEVELLMRGDPNVLQTISELRRKVVESGESFASSG